MRATNRIMARIMSGIGGAIIALAITATYMSSPFIPLAHGELECYGTAPAIECEQEMGS